MLADKPNGMAEQNLGVTHRLIVNDGRSPALVRGSAEARQPR